MLSRLADFIQSPAFREAARRDPRHFTRQRDLPFPELIAFLLSGVRGAVQGVRAIHAEIRGAYGSPRINPLDLAVCHLILATLPSGRAKI